MRIAVVSERSSVEYTAGMNINSQKKEVMYLYGTRKCVVEIRARCSTACDKVGTAS